MNHLELIVFNVGHGLSVAMIEQPERYVTLVDLGSEGPFSPVQSLARDRGLRADVLYLTHPHGDHLNDIAAAFRPEQRPLSVFCQDYDWNDVSARERPQFRHKIEALRHLLNLVPRGEYQGAATMTPWCYPPLQAQQYFGDSDYVNNSSLLLVYQWRHLKVAIAGDQSKAVVDALINCAEFCSSAQGAAILVAPHHGHSAGYTGLWPKHVGKPFVTIVSVQSRDPNIDERYSKPDFAEGIDLEGQKRYSLTTRHDGHILVGMWYDDNGKPRWKFTCTSNPR